MNKHMMLDLLLEVLDELRSIKRGRAENLLYSVISSYEEAVRNLEKDEINENPITNSPRVYLEIYSDYDNPLLQKMDYAQRQLNFFVVTGTRK
ncbi:hypothetical protein H7698_28845 [Pseudomonas sp. p50]|uniref:hypothetical protein n=1 Tax=Pseudomonas sp. p50(2008) TaxID=2816832 RepID=UPI00188CA1F8|nr:hypothetical protein [Pseudomonas sp. p50(2008)]MBF4560080.1 hypothetical protein [Pseudomonas sp. p50(2008)]